MELIEIIKENYATFSRYHSGNLFYTIEVDRGHYAETFTFTVPVYELDGAVIHAREKASVFLKWIKRTLKEIEENNLK